MSEQAEKVEKIDLDRVQHTIEEENKINTNLSPNKLVKTQARQMQDSVESLASVSSAKPDVDKAPPYSAQSFFTSFNNIFKTLISPKEASCQSNFFASVVKKNETPTYGQLVTFYIYHLVLTMIYITMSIIRLAQYQCNTAKLRFLSLAYNPADDPEVINNDVNKLSKIPRRISVILNYRSEQEENGGVEGLCHDSASVVAWCLSSGIPELSIYEYHGVLKQQVPQLSRAIYRQLTAYFGTDDVPDFVIRIPHLNLSFGGDGKQVTESSETAFEISLLSAVDGRPTVVELTKVMADLARKGDLKPKDITLKFMDQELQQLVGKEPDLVIMFQPFLNLQGYPPWQIRLSELYWEPDNDSTCYAVFLRALQKYSTCKVNVGR